MANRQLIVAFGAGVIGAGALAFAVGLGPDDDKAHGGMDAAAQEMSPEAMAEMQQWMDAGTPGEQHEMLAKSVGEWTCTTWFKMDPDAPAMESTGTVSTKPVLGGRYFQSHFHMDDMMGMPFDGIAFMGYDNIQDRFVSTWIDSMSTGIFSSTGKMSSDGTKLIMTGTMTEPDGTVTATKMVTEWVGDDKIIDTMYDDVDGEWNLHGKITYTRKGAHAHADN